MEVQTQPRTLLDVPETPESSSRAFGAGFILQNPVSTYLYQPDKPFLRPIKGYDPFDERVEDLRNYDPMDFIESKSPQETAYIKTRIDNERQLRSEAQSSTWGVVGEIAGAVSNPVLSGAALASGGLGLPGVIAAETAGEVISETILQQQQYERTLTETAVNIGSAFVVTSVLGGIVSKLESRQVNQLINEVQADLQGTGGSAKAFEADETDRLVGGKVAETVAVGPLARVLASDSPAARALAQRLVDNPFILKKFKEGRSFGPSLESQLGHYEGLHFEAFDTTRKAFNEYRKTADKPLSFEAFDIEVGRALSNEDKHVIPQVQRVAQWYRKQIFDPTLKEAQNMDVLPKTKGMFDSEIGRVLDEIDKESDHILDLRMQGKRADDARLNRLRDDLDELHAARKEAPENLLTGALSYFPRVYDFDKVIRHYDDIKQQLAHYAIRNDEDELLEWDDAESIATDILRNLLGGEPLDRAVQNVIPRASATQERVLDIPDRLLEPYLEKRASVVVGKHLNDMGKEIEFAKRFSNKRLSDETREIAEEYAFKIDAATGKEKTRLIAEKKQVIADIQAMRDRLHGIYLSPDPANRWVRAGRNIRAWNTMAMLGGVTLSSMSDLARPLMIYGLKPYAKGLANVVFNTKAYNLSRQQMKKWGVGLEASLADANYARFQQMTDNSDTLGKTTRAGLHYFGKATGISYWNSGLKQFTAVMGTDTILGTALRKNVGVATKAKLARAGLNEDTLRVIAKEFEAHGETVQGLRIPNTSQWTDKEAARALEAAVRSDAELAIITPGVGDAPLFMSSEMGRLIAQFKSFLFSATNRMLINGLQTHDAAFAGGLLMSVGLGALVGMIKAEVRGEDTSRWTPEQWLLEGIDRSGVAGIYGVPMAWATAATDITPSRYLASNIEGQLFGPTAGQVGRTARIASDVLTGNVNDYTGENLLRLAPGQNLLHLRQIMEQAGQ